MTTATAQAPTTAHATPPSVPTRSARRRPPWVTPAIVILLMLASALAVTVLTRGPQGNTDDLDPTNPGVTGAQGLAHVLRDHGVTVSVVRSQGELLRRSIDSTTTVVIPMTRDLSGRTARTALAHSASAASLVLLDPDAEVTKGMGLPVDPHLTLLEGVAAGCRSTDVGEGFRLAQAHRAYTPRTAAPNVTACFPDKATGGTAMLTLPVASGRPPVTLLGDDTLITNGAILDADNAAIALGLFGHTDQVIWYIPSVADITAGEATSRSIAPAWFGPGLVLAGSATVLLCLWRGRRLGRLVTEPLPVVVRAVETTESRGRMYRKSRDRGRAVAVLQLATRRRLATYLGLSGTSPTSSVAAAAAAVSGRTYDDVLNLLTSSSVADDDALLERANTLAAIEKEVRQP
jgi:hypothetical protein